MKKMIALLLLLATPSIYANHSVEMAPINFQICGNDALSRFEQAIFYPEGVLKHDRPAGAQISNKHVSQNVINFVATKSLLFVSKSVYVNGILEAKEDNQRCSKNDFGYELSLRFDSSDNLITSSVERLEGVICLRPHSDTSFIGILRSKIILKNDYSKILGPMAIDLIKLQLSPLLSALSEEIKYSEGR